jgi:membrane-associated phospholipid phosphatase
VYLGVHYPSDVIAGFIAGFFVFSTAIVLDRSLSFRKIVETVKTKEKQLKK